MDEGIKRERRGTSYKSSSSVSASCIFCLILHAFSFINSISMTLNSVAIKPAAKFVLRRSGGPEMMG